MRGLQGQIKALEAKIGALEVPKEVPVGGPEGGGKRREEIEEMTSGARGAQLAEQPELGDYQAGTTRVERFLEQASDR